MGKVVIVYNEEDEKYSVLIKLIVEEFSVRNFETESLCIRNDGSKNKYTSFLQNAGADYICTLDMAGFWLDTLLEMPFYDILTAKQLHVIMNQERLDSWRDKEFALNLFFAVPGAVREWKKEYPYILNMEEYSSFETDEKNIILDSETNRDIVKFIIDRFFRNVGES